MALDRENAAIRHERREKALNQERRRSLNDDARGLGRKITDQRLPPG